MFTSLVTKIRPTLSELEDIEILHVWPEIKDPIWGMQALRAEVKITGKTTVFCMSCAITKKDRKGHTKIVHWSDEKSKIVTNYPIMK